MNSAPSISALFPPYPALEQPDAETLLSLEPEQVATASEAWKEAIALAKRDPLNYGYIPQNWKDARELLEDPSVDFLTVFGGNRGSKTRFSAWMVMKALMLNPGTKIACWSQSEALSNEVQQPALFEMLPPELRKKSKGISYTSKNGFTGNSFVLPNGSKCLFQFYTQFLQNPGFFEGIELGWKAEYGKEAGWINLGNWFDEYLIDPSLMHYIAERLSTRNAKGLKTFTPIHQYTETVEEVLDGAQTLRTSVAEIDEVKGTVIPYIQQGANPSWRIIYFYTRENRFHNYERTKRNLAGKPKEWILMKAYGVPTKVSSSKFPKFAKHVNVLPHAQILSYFKDSNGERAVSKYRINDPAGDKPWFLAWVAVDQDENHYIYREWPSYDQWGPWAERREGKWVPGEAQTGPCCGMGYESYRDLIEAEEEPCEESGWTEDKDEIEDSYIDPRLGAQKVQTRGVPTSIINEMEELGITFRPVPGLPEAEGVQRLQALMDYDTERPVDGTNKPKFFVSERCGNIIRALSGYDTPPGKVDLKHPWKDPVDVCRYAAVADLAFIPDNYDDPATTGGY